MQARQTLLPREKAIGGGFRVARLLPSAQRQAVGPFLFFDHFGPVTATPADNHDVRPHPHIGLATVTYLFEGAMLHRDSLGFVQRIEPGAINWMTAGRGIVHSERTPDDLRGLTRRSHGIQLWSALPAEDEETDPAFVHTPADAIPVFERGPARVRVLIGSAFGLTSPVAVRSPTLYLDLELQAGASIDPPAAAEAALYSVDAEFELGGERCAARQMVVLGEAEKARITATQPARIVLIGGDPLGRRHMWWNFVSSRRERIGQARDDWQAQRFAAVPGETEFVPLP